MEKVNKSRIAILIDADNVSFHYFDVIQPEVARYGVPTIKRIYGDWTNNNLSGWKPLLQENAIMPVQQFSYTTGKNSTDSALIIDAMDLLYSGVVDSFCLVSSDSDFTRLATRLREAGKTVFGFGEKKTPNAFIAACDRFVYIDVLKERQTEEETEADLSDDEAVEESERGPDVERTAKKTRGGRPRKEDRPVSSEGKTLTQARQDSNGSGRRQPQRGGNRPSGLDRATRRLIYQCIEDVTDENGWANLGDVGNLLSNIRPDFDARNYGFSKLTDLMRYLHKVEVDERPTNFPNVKHIFIRTK